MSKKLSNTPIASKTLQNTSELYSNELIEREKGLETSIITKKGKEYMKYYQDHLIDKNKTNSDNNEVR